MIVLLIVVMSANDVEALDLRPGFDSHVDAGIGGAFYEGDHRRTVLHLAAGGEVRFGRVGILGELGGAVSPGSAHDESGGTVTGALTAHLSPDRGNGLDPYVVAGWSAAFRTGGVGAFSVGGGVNVRSAHLPRLRVSLIDHTRWGLHLIELRLGVGF